jgi:hypothetical protein
VIRRTATLAFAARRGRRFAGSSIDSLTAQSLPGTDDATNPFWSPDSRFIGHPPGKLMKVAPSAGPPQTLAEMSGPTFAARGGVEPATSSCSTMGRDAPAPRVVRWRTVLAGWAPGAWEEPPVFLRFCWTAAM